MGLKFTGLSTALTIIFIVFPGRGGGGKAFHRVKVQYTRKGAAFFVVHGYRIPLNECIRMGV